MRISCRCAWALCALLILPWTVFAQRPHVYPVTGDVAWTHDPSIMHAGHTWYVFATGRAPVGGQFPIRCSHDLVHWKLCGQVFNSIPEWIQRRSPGTRDLWAPDISYENHEYRLYYAYSLFGKNASGIALAVNKTLDAASPQYRWIDKGLVLESTTSDNFNAIDPNFVRDRHGRSWLVFGSFWDGIKMRRLNSGGKLSSADTRLYSLARRARPSNAAPAKPGLPPDWQAVEAPFLVQHGGFYYLFTSWDLCCRGVHSTYRIMVGRSRNVTGPYRDRSGKALLDGGGTELLHGNSRWVGPGGESLWMSRDGGLDLMIFHAYDAKTGRPSMQLSTVVWKNGWPEVAMEQ
jgi:arabinan endo-1,5-alpha-L-arabinosidase